jgi:hypothetical protein
MAVLGRGGYYVTVGVAERDGRHLGETTYFFLADSVRAAYELDGKRLAARYIRHGRARSADIRLPPRSCSR